jgi:hypothetical protein
MRLLVLTLVLVVATPGVGRAQLVVNDPAVTLQNTLTAIMKEYTLLTQREQHEQLRRMSRRLSAFASLSRYRLPDVPRWRTHDFENPEAFLFARPYHAALNYGDGSGAAFLGVSHQLAGTQEVLSRLPADARRELAARLATVDLAASTAVAGTHDSGRLRFNGRRELQAIDLLDQDVTNDSQDESTGAVLSKISGAVLIAGRQRQARLQLLSGIVEQLLVDTKRTRDADTTALGMQLRTWRDAPATNAALVAGSGAALAGWRQP